MPCFVGLLWRNRRLGAFPVLNDEFLALSVLERYVYFDFVLLIAASIILYGCRDSTDFRSERCIEGHIECLAVVIVETEVELMQFTIRQQTVYLYGVLFRLHHKNIRIGFGYISTAIHIC